MAKFTYHLGVPVFPDLDYNPFFDELFNLDDAELRGKPSSTLITMTLSNGLVAQVGGTGFDPAGKKDTGTIKTIKILLEDGKTAVMSWSGLAISMEDFADNAPHMNPWQLGGWISRGNDLMNGGAGHDDLFGGLGDDTINGGAGDDYIDGGAGKDTFDGGAGYDQLSFANAFLDPAAFRGIDLNAAKGTVIDAYGNSETFKNFESYRGTQFADKMVGSALDEQFMGLGGKDTIDGGGGFDTVRYHRDDRGGGDNGVTVDLGAGYAIDGFGRRDTLISIEGAQGTEQDDKLTGSSGYNDLRGGGGDDILNGGAGADKMRGGAGNDTYFVDNAGDSIDEQVDGNLGVDTVQSTISFSLLATAHLKGSLENLTLLGSANINGTGNALNNILTGNSGVNTLNGGAGNDFLNGGLGADTLTGGSGRDNFVFNTALTSVDKITDFSVKDDTIRLENAIFTALKTTGVLNAQAFTANAAGVAQDGLDRIIYETDTGKLIYDSNGNAAGGAVHFATLSAGLALTNADFLVI